MPFVASWIPPGTIDLDGGSLRGSCGFHKEKLGRGQDTAGHGRKAPAVDRSDGVRRLIQASRLYPPTSWIFAANLIFFGSNLLDERPEVGERFIKALLRGIEQYNLGKTERNLEILEGAMRLSREELATMCWVSMYADGRMHPEGFVGYQEWAMQRGLVDHVLSADELIDTRFLDSASARSEH